MSMKVASVAVVLLLAITLVAGCGSGVKTSGEKSIYAAAASGDTATVREGLNNGFKVNTPDKDGMTLLHHAAQGNQADLVELLRERYAARVDAKDSKGRTPLDVAQEAGANEAAQRLAQGE